MSKEKLFIAGGSADRPDSPFVDQIAYNHARHHGIPYHTLRDIFNFLVQQEIKLIENPKTTGKQSISRSLKNFLTLVCISSDDICAFFIEIQKACEDSDDEKNQLRPDFIDIIHSKVAWPGWNIVIGPRNRTDDDLKGTTEPFHKVPHTPKNRKIVYSHALLVVETFTAYMDSPTDLDKKKAFETALKDAAKVVNHKVARLNSPLAYDDRLWEKVEPTLSRHASLPSLRSLTFFQLVTNDKSSASGSSSRPSSQ